MKRFTLIFSLLMIVCFGVKAQEVYVTNLDDLSNEKTYLIESSRCILIIGNKVLPPPQTLQVTPLMRHAAVAFKSNPSLKAKRHR